MKKMKQWLSLALCLCLSLGLFGLEMPAKAATTITTPLVFTADTADASGEGWTWVKDTKKLTLDGLDLQVATSTDSTLTALTVPDGTEIIVNGANSIAIGGSTAFEQKQYGLYSTGKVTLSGSGTLTATSGNSSSSTAHSYPIFMDGDSSSLTINGPTVNASAYLVNTNKGVGYGVNVMGKLTMMSGSLTGKGAQKGGISRGIHARNLDVQGGSITANCYESTNLSSIAFYVGGASAAQLSITGGTITATAGPTGSTDLNAISSGLAIYSVTKENMTISGGSLTLKGELMGFRSSRDSDTPVTETMVVKGAVAMGDEADKDVTFSNYVYKVEGENAKHVSITEPAGPSIVVTRTTGESDPYPGESATYGVTISGFDPSGTPSGDWCNDDGSMPASKTPASSTLSYDSVEGKLTASIGADAEPGTYYFIVSGMNNTTQVKSNTVQLKIETPSLTLTPDEGNPALIGGKATGIAKYGITETGCTASTVEWYSDTAGTTGVSAPTGVQSAIAGGTLTLSLNSGATWPAGTYYFRVTNGGTVKSSVVTLKVSIPELTVNLTAGSGKVTLAPQAGDGTFYYKKTESDDSNNKPAYDTTTDLIGWTALTEATDIEGPNGTAIYVQVAKVDDSKFKAWGQASATPKADPAPGPVKNSPAIKQSGSNDVVIEAGDSDPVEVSVELSGANVGSGVQLTATIGGVTASATATENGKLTITFPAGALNGLKEGEYDIVVSFAGDANNNPCSAKVGTASVEPADEFDIGIDVLAVKKGKKLVLPKFKGYTGSWSVKDESVAAIVKKGKRVKAKALGTTKLVYTVEAAPKKALVINDRTLKAGDQYEITLNVRKKGELVTKLTLDKRKLALSTVGNTTAQLVATVKPSKALDKEVFWTSSNPKVATVDKQGNITAVGKGKCKITAVSTSLKRMSATVTVKGAIEVKPAKKSVKVGKQLTLTATVVDGIDKQVTWASSKPDVATVDENGVVTAIKKGKTTITVTAANGETATATITVKK